MLPVRPEPALVVGLLALLPVAAFGIGRLDPIVALSAVSVVLIVASLVLMWSGYPESPAA